jgi:hypothetical protein
MGYLLLVRAEVSPAQLVNQSSLSGSPSFKLSASRALSADYHLSLHTIPTISLYLEIAVSTLLTVLVSSPFGCYP